MGALRTRKAPWAGAGLVLGPRSLAVSKCQVPRPEDQDAHQGELSVLRKQPAVLFILKPITVNFTMWSGYFLGAFQKTIFKSVIK